MFKIILNRINILLQSFKLVISVQNITFQSFKELKNILVIYRNTKNISAYNRLINRLTKQSFKRIKFVGEGGGAGTTQTHAIIKTSDGFIFEKIFNIKSETFKTIANNYHYIYEQLNHQNIKIPGLVDIYKMGDIALCHFEYIDNLIPIASNDIDVRLKLLKQIQAIKPNQAFYHRNYEEITIIKNRLKSILFELSKTNYIKPFLAIKEFVEGQKKVFTHGDFYSSNIFENVIIDWDDAGLYPFGIDDAAIYFNTVDVSCLNTSFNDFYKQLETYTKEEKIGIIFFFILYEYKVSTKEVILEWIENLYKEL